MLTRYHFFFFLKILKTRFQFYKAWHVLLRFHTKENILKPPSKWITIYSETSIRFYIRQIFNIHHIFFDKKYFNFYPESINLFFL